VTEPDVRDPHAATRAFFGPRARTWDERFPDDAAAFAAAVAALGLRTGDTALDVGCGTGRALPALRAAVGTSGTVVGLDVTPEMVEIARGRGPAVLADAAALPFATSTMHAVLAAGLLHHLADPIGGLRELARVTRPAGRLALFHPIGRAALAARRGHELSADDIRDPANLPDALAATGWRSLAIDDGAHRYLALARRGDGRASGDVRFDGAPARR
jgi:SAM-dependent methyltransferase